MFKKFDQGPSMPHERRVASGTAADDALFVGEGDDILSAGGGDDVYFFDRKDGFLVTIDDGALLSSHINMDGGGHDALVLLGIDKADLTYKRDGGDLLLAHVDDVDDDSIQCGVRIHHFYGDSSDPTDLSYGTSTPAASIVDNINMIENVVTDDLKLIDLELL